MTASSAPQENAPPLYAVETLIERLVDSLCRSTKRIVFVFGSGLTCPRGDSPGIPSTAAIVSEALESLQERDRTTTQGLYSDYARYQFVLERLHGSKGPDYVNRFIRGLVMRGLLQPALPKVGDDATDESRCLEIQRSASDWHINAGLRSVAELILRFPKTISRYAITTNFDPLLEVAVRAKKGDPVTVALDSDGSLGVVFGDVPIVIHVHGFWVGTDTLHAQHALRHERPGLEAFLDDVLRDSLTVVMGYGGWDDILSRVFSRLLQGRGEHELLWCFFENAEDVLGDERAKLLEQLREGIARGRVTLFHGIDVDDALPKVLDRLKSRKPAETLEDALIHAKRILAASQEESGRLNGDLIGELVKEVGVFNPIYALLSAIAATEYAALQKMKDALPTVQSIRETTSSPRNDVREDEYGRWRLAVVRGKDAAKTLEEQAVWRSVEELAEAARLLADPNSLSELRTSCAKAVFAAHRAVEDDGIAIWNYIQLQLVSARSKGV